MSERKKRIEEKQVLQAVLICDSFNSRFQPLTASTPRVLLPLINRPILEYSLNTLKSSGIEDIFIVCCAHSQQIRDFVAEWSKNRANKTVSVQVFSSDSYHSFGDALRDLDAKALVRHEFVLMFGDCISNLKLKEYLDEHKCLTKTDKNAVMTLIYKRSSSERIFKTGDEEVMIIVDGATKKLLQYEKMPKTQKKVDVSVALLREHRNAKVHFNLQDTHIAICSVNVLSLFSDNFDYETKDDFMRGILEQEEILGNTIYVKICNANTYSSRITNVFSYDVISREILQRWAFPIVPDMQSKFCFQRHNIYKFDNVMLSMDSTAVRNVAIGTNTVIGGNAFMVNCVIGSNCKIGNNVTIDGSYVWDNVVIEDNCILKNSIVSHNVTLKKSCKLFDGCLIAESVILGPEIELSTKYIQSEPNDEDEKIDVNLVGKEGKGYLYNEDVTDDDGFDTPEIWGAERNQENDEISLSSSDSRDLDLIEEELDEVNTFYKEVLDSCQRAFDENIATENLILEVNSSKHAYNIPIKELAFLVSRSILDLPALQKKSDPGMDYASQLMTVLKRFLPLIKNYIKTDESELCLLTALEEFAITNPMLLTSVLLAKTLGFLYNADVLSEENLLKWYKSLTPIPSLLNDEECSLADQQNLRASDGVQRFFKWLEEAEEESEDSD